MPEGSYMQEIFDEDVLRVGVDQNTRGFGYRTRDGEIEGFDMSLAEEIGLAIFGEPGHVVPQAVVSAERIPAIQRGDVDLVASVMTMTCGRWEDVAFSTEYFRGHQRVLVRSDSDIDDVADLAGRRVCATRGSTSIDNLAEFAPTAERYEVATRTECLVALQEGEVDAISTDDTILFGFQFQDPKTRLLPDTFHEEPYGIAIHHDHPEFVRFVNGVLEQMRVDGRWAELLAELRADLDLGPEIEISDVPPAASYRD
jgi:polar amino acid transport system substrate-binding protein